MKQTIILVTAFLALFMTQAQAVVENPRRNFRFADRSRLERGTWIKVQTDEEGIYEISYDELSSMGLRPQYVSVWGCGGMFKSSSLMDSDNKTRLHNDNLDAVPALHHNSKVYFYAAGVRNPRLSANTFQESRSNLYSDHGYYLITDNENMLPLSSAGDASSLAASATERTTGLGYVQREKDCLTRYHNAMGQYQYEYSLIGTDKSWTFPTPYLAAGPASVNFTVFNETSCNGNLTIGLNGVTATSPAYAGYYTRSASVAMTLPADKTLQVSINATTATYNSNQNYFDSFTATYTKDLRGAGPELVAELMGLPADASITDAGKIKVPDGALVWDISDIAAPLDVPVSGGYAYFPDGGKLRTLMVFNPANRQRKISGWSSVANQNLHNQKFIPYAMLIVTVPEYMEQARRIAGYHRDFNGAEALIVTPEQCYNEFTQGNPHPAAIRMLAKMIYENGRALKNVLLLGPLRSDARNILQRPMPDNFIIGFQTGEKDNSTENAPSIALDYYGITSDVVNDMYLFNSQVDLAVGTLPVSSVAEADIAADKIRDYLANLRNPDMAALVNETLLTTHEGDNHEHDRNGKVIYDDMTLIYKALGVPDGLNNHTTMMANFYKNPGTNPSSNAIYGKETYLESRFRNLWLDKINQGTLLMTYVGHSNEFGFSTYLSGNDLASLRNPVTGFGFVAGCDAVVPDFGGRGVGSDMVLSGRRGFVGAVVSTRTALSSTNRALTQYFNKALYRTPYNYFHSNTRTVGEVYIQMKNQTNHYYNNPRYTLPFIYMGDPALPVPAPLRRVDIDPIGTPSAGGDVVKVSGTITDSNGSLISDYNGKVVLKLCEPSVTVGQPVDPSYKMKFDNIRMASFETTVTNGRFSTSITLPRTADRFRRDASREVSLNLHASAYSPAKCLAAAGYTPVPLAAYNAPEGETGTKDREKPALSASYNPETLSLDISVADAAIMPGIGPGCGLSLTIDGNPVTAGGTDGIAAAVTQFQTSYPLHRFAEGKHKAVISAIDVAGNKTSGVTVTFTLSKTFGAPLLSAPVYGREQVEFDLSGLKDATDAYLVVIDNNGKEVYRGPADNGSLTWNCTDASEGVYKAAVRCEGVRRIASPWVTFSVIK